LNIYSEVKQAEHPSIYCTLFLYKYTRKKGSGDLDRDTMATISIPNPVPSAIEDAEKLRKAFQGTTLSLWKKNVSRGS
jgi:hypothetical protein